MGRTAELRAITSKFAVAAAALVLAGCASVSPQNIRTDRMEYGQVLADSWKRQTLLNVVRLRYGDAPIFLDVSSIINSYSVAGKASARAQFPGGVDPNLFDLGTEGTWSNTPTVTYQPLMGDRFTRSLLQPIPPSAILQLVQSGWSAEIVFGIVVRSINGLRNTSAGVGRDARFQELIDTIDRVQAAGAFDMRVRPRRDGSAVVMVLSGATATEGSLKADRRRLAELLGVREDATELEVVYGLAGRGGEEIAIITRSMLELMLELGFNVDLPENHATDGRTLPGRGRPGVQPRDRLLRIRSGNEAPADAYAAVNYQGHWFWIDGNDFASKSRFTFLLLLFSLAETGQSAAAPVVTVPSR
jgi:hypothetical protein